MKLKNKGFTLVELLAVIVILAVIALIATPQILKLINDSRVKAANDSMYGYVKAVEQAYVKEAITATEKYAPLAYDKLSKGSITHTKVAPETTDVSLAIDLKGSSPEANASGDNTAGTVLVLDETGTVKCAKIKFGNYYVDYDGDTASSNSDKFDTAKTCTV